MSVVKSKKSVSSEFQCGFIGRLLVHGEVCALSDILVPIVVMYLSYIAYECISLL